MDESSQLITDQARNDLYNELLDAVYSALKNEEITDDEAQKSAEFVMPRLDEVKTKDELLIFLEELAQKWPIFSNTYLLIKSEYDNKVKLNQIHKEINSLT